jgi:uncharacterized protein
MTEDELSRFKQKLVESTSFPTVYMYKFIIPSNHRNIALVESLFEAGTDILLKESGTGRYTSITVKQVVVNPDEIIDMYRRAAKIEGLIFL